MSDDQDSSAMSSSRSALFVLAVAIAGCIDSNPISDSSDEPGSLALGSPVHLVTGVPTETLALDPPVPVFREPVIVSDVYPGAEPVLAIASDGTLFLQGTGSRNQDGITNRFWRSLDDGRTWEDVTPPFPTASEESLDAFVAVATDDTVIAANVVGTALFLFRSTDLGATWTPVVHPLVTPAVHRMWIAPGEGLTLHLAIESLAPPAPLYYMRSEDGGATWEAPVVVDKDSAFGSNLAVGPAGDLYIARYPVAGEWYLKVSEDGGKNWETRAMPRAEEKLARSWMTLRADAAGTLYFVWVPIREGVAQTHFAWSKDGGRTWSDSRTVAPTNGSQVLAWADVRAPGELGVAWYAADEPGEPSSMSASWYVDYALVREADTDEPISVRTRLTSDPVHEGSVCTDGPFCVQNGGDRRLLDYLWVAFGPDGRAHVAFASTIRASGMTAAPMHAAEREPQTE